MGSCGETGTSEYIDWGGQIGAIPKGVSREKREYGTLRKRKESAVNWSDVLNCTRMASS
jgi:hypothetical protein